MKELVIQRLKDRGVEIDDISPIVFEIQKNYIENLTVEYCKENILEVLNKREVQYAILTGMELDRLASENLIEEPLLSIIKSDEPRYGIDEVIAISIANIYGSIGFTNFGYLDKVKFGIIKDVDLDKKNVGTFLDDILSAICAAAAARMAHDVKE